MGGEQVPPPDRTLTRSRSRVVAVTAIVLALLWGALVVFTGWRLGWIAPVIGLVIGLSLRVPTRAAAYTAVLLTLGAIVFGRGCAAVGSRFYVSGHELNMEPSLVFDAVSNQLFPPDMPQDDPFNPKPNAFEKMSRVQKEVSKMSEGEKRAAVAAYLGSTDVPVARTSPARSLFGWLDLVWWSAALWLAYRLNAPRRVERKLGLVETSVYEFQQQQQQKPK